MSLQSVSSLIPASLPCSTHHFGTIFFNIWHWTPDLCINSIRHYLSVETTKKLVLAFVMSSLNYCNSLPYDCPKCLINRLQKVQNNAAHLILKVPKNLPHYATLTNSTRASSTCKHLVQNWFSMLQCHQLFWPSVPCWPTQDLGTFSPTPLFCWHLYTVHSFNTHKTLSPTCLFTLCTHSPEQPF